MKDDSAAINEYSTEVDRLADAVRDAIASTTSTADPEASERLLARLASSAQRLSAALLMFETGSQIADLCELLVAVHELQSALRDHSLGLRFVVLTRIHEELAALRQVSSADELIQRAPAALSRCCGFDRVLLSTVRGSTWTPSELHMIHSSDEPSNVALARFIQDREIPMTSSMLEAELLRRRAPALISNAQTDPRAYAPIITAADCTSYVAAPIVNSGPVVGLFHADTRFTSRRLTSFDRDNLHTFAVGFSLIYERAVIVSRLTSQRDHVSNAFARVKTLLDELQGTQVELTQQSQPVDMFSPDQSITVFSSSPSRIDGLLTPREREVLEHMASGATNLQIADQLVISEGTVKSHVKHILRKLRASNRAEAVSRYLRIARSGQRPQ